jgi:hypothetical protein
MSTLLHNAEKALATLNADLEKKSKEFAAYLETYTAKKEEVDTLRKEVEQTEAVVALLKGEADAPKRNTETAPKADEEAPEPKRKKKSGLGDKEFAGVKCSSCGQVGNQFRSFITAPSGKNLPVIRCATERCTSEVY